MIILGFFTYLCNIFREINKFMMKKYSAAIQIVFFCLFITFVLSNPEAKLAFR